MKKKVEKSKKHEKRLDKKVITIFLTALFLVVLPGFIGVMTATGARKINKNFTKFDHILFWENGLRGTVEQNLALGNGSEVKYWQPIEQKYGLGYINSTGNIARFWSIKGQVTQAKVGKTAKCASSNKKSMIDYIDHIDGATHMGEFYDVREYFWKIRHNPGVRNTSPANSNGIDQVNKNTVANYNECQEGEEYGESPSDRSALGLEFHFYPRGTLASLEELTYVNDTKAGLVLCDPSVDGTIICKHTRKKSVPIVPAPTDPKAPTSTTVPIYEKDTYAYRDKNGDVIYTGYYNDKNGNFKYSAKTYQEYLKAAEDSIQLYGHGPGEFAGTVAFYDIDSWANERYVPVSGVQSVFTVYNSVESARKEAINLKKNVWYNEFCPNSSPDQICYYAWGGANEGSPQKDQYRIWLNYVSTSERPLGLIYAGAGHGSGFISTTTTVAYVFNDDINELPDGVLEAIDDFADEYQKLYGRELREDPFFSTHPEVEPEKVLRLFNVFQFSEYDPYLINDYLANLEDMNGNRLNWYNCSETIMGNCKIPYLPEHDDPNKTETVNGVEYVNGYDFIKTESKVYYGSVNDHLDVHFDNTCYSDNPSIVETGDYDR